MRRPRRARTRRAARTIWLPVTVAVTATALCGHPAAADTADTAAADTSRRHAASPVAASPVAASPVAASPVAAGLGAADPVCGASSGDGRAGCFALRRTDVPVTSGVQPHEAPPAGYGPADLRAAYGLPDNGGAGATIAVITAYDTTRAEADLAVYRAQYGLPACTTDNGCYRLIGQDGGPGPRGSISGSWGQQTALGLDMASAIAPAAHLLVVTADSDDVADLGAAVNQAVAQGARFVSNGYGFGFWGPTPGTPEDPSQLTAWDSYFDHPGVAIVAAAGDYGYGTSFPASSRHVTAVAGTTLTRDDSTRGFTETVWHADGRGTGSGCSAYEPKPAFQTDRGCANRTVADVAAVADPATGVAVYVNGWGVYGGTSVAAPIIAGVYAVAGAPAEGSYPNAYPYARRAALHDVTEGRNGNCEPAYLCTAGAGYDGPSGLGTPNGTTAFHAGPYGTLTGVVTDTDGRPVPGVGVRAGPADAVTDLHGRYTLHLPPGTYQVTATRFGYQAATAAQAAVADGATATTNLRLTALPQATVEGHVTDGAGHGWPLYAKITVAGMPGAVFTDPVTGRYRLDLPSNATHDLTVVPAALGYRPTRTAVTVGSGTVRADVGLSVDAETCAAPGYRERLTGDVETFDDPTTPAGWTVRTATGHGGWRFDDPGQRGNRSGSGGLATASSDVRGAGEQQDTALVAPAADLRAATAPVVSFDTEYQGLYSQTADVELSLDGGAGWTSIWHHDSDAVPEHSHVRIPIPQAAGASGVLVRFRYTAQWGYWWQVDNVFVGDRGCDANPGGLIVGQVVDANVGTGLTGAEVGACDTGATATTTLATPDDPGLGEGFYTAFAPTGTRQVTAARHRYVRATAPVSVADDAVTRVDLTLTAGRLTVDRTNVDQTVGLATTGTAAVGLTNTGTAPATVTVDEQPGGFQPLAGGAGAGAPARRVAGNFSPRRVTAPGDNHDHRATPGTAKPGGAEPGTAKPGTAKPGGAEPGTAKPGTAKPGTAKPGTAKPGVVAARGAAAGVGGGEGAWAGIANLPRTIQDNIAAAHGGKLYTAFGMPDEENAGRLPLSALYVYDPAAGGWSQLASATNPRSGPAGAFIGDRLYAAGGWRPDGSVEPTLERYDPATNTWTTGASQPRPSAGAGSAVVGGRLYVVGGCGGDCGTTDVQVYDPVSDVWSIVASYPEPVSWSSCGGIGGKLYCTGGARLYGDDYVWPTPATYAYDPATNTWTPRASLPVTVWGAASAAANGRLLVVGGVSDGYVTNEGYAYDPDSDTWSRLPNSGRPSLRAAGACGFYRAGGDGASAEVLAGNADCAEASSWLSTSWLSTAWLSSSGLPSSGSPSSGSPSGTNQITLQPGASVTLSVTLDATASAVAQPGTYTSRLTLETDTPYPAASLPVAMAVPPPPTWGRLAGTITSAVDGKPLPDTTVQVDASAASYTVTTNDKGEYGLWLDAGGDPIQVIAAREHYQPQARTVRVTPGATTTASFTLKKKP